jgi:hypothetical protein
MDKLAIYNRSNRLITYFTDGNEIAEIQGDAGGTVQTYYYPRLMIYDNDNNRYYFISSPPSQYFLNGDLVKASNTTTVNWVVPAVNFQSDPDDFGVQNANSIVKIVLGSDGYIYIATRVRIYVYDSAGVYVTDFGGYGTGDNQFIGIVDFAESAGFLYITEFSCNLGVADTAYLKVLQNDGTFIYKKDIVVPRQGTYDYVSYRLAVTAANIYLIKEKYLNIPLMSGLHISTCYKLDLNGNEISSFELTGADSDHPGSHNLIATTCIINSAGELVVVYSDTNFSANPTINRWDLSAVLLGSELMSNLFANQGMMIYQDTNNDYWISSYAHGYFSLNLGYPPPVKAFDAGFGFGFSAQYNLFVFTDVISPPTPYDFSFNQGIAWLNGMIFLTDGNVANSYVYMFDIDLNYIGLFGGLGAGNGQLASPAGISADRHNNRIVVVDSFNNRIAVFDDVGNWILNFSGGGIGVVDQPISCAVDHSNGDIYVTMFSYSFVYKYDDTGAFLFRFGGAGAGNGQFAQPVGIEVDNEGNVYVIDEGNNRIQKFDSLGNYILKWAIHPASFPYDLCYGGQKIFVANEGFSTVDVYGKTGNPLYSFGSMGQGWGQFAFDYYIDYIELGQYKRLINYTRDKVLIGR